MATEKLYVEDLNCSARHPKRTHEVLDSGGSIVLYEMNRGEKVEMPYADAVKFLRDPAFKVTDAEKNVLLPTPATPKGPISITLAPDQVIARLDELTQGALSIRVAQSPGGEKMAKNATKGTMINHLLKGQSGPVRKREAAPDEIDDSAGIMDDLSAEIEMGAVEVV